MIELDYARRAERREVDIACDVVASEWDEPLSHRATDLSPYGMWLRTALPLEIGERLVVSFRPPKSQRELNVFAEVRRVELRHRLGERSGMGLQFMDLSKDERHALHACLRHLPAWRRLRPGPARRQLRSRRAFR